MQLLMRNPDITALPPLNVPAELTVRTFRPGEEQLWEDLFMDSFRGHTSFEGAMSSAACYKPERIFFVEFQGVPVASAAAWINESEPETGTIHMVGAKRGAPKGVGYYAVLAALYALREEGFTTARLNTDDWRLPAIVTYLKLGFVPDETIDTDMPARWKAIYANLETFKLRNKQSVTLPGGAVLFPFFLAGENNTCILVCPGGGYSGLADHEKAPIAKQMNIEGLSAAVLHYHTTPDRPDRPLEDVQQALAYLRQNAEKYGIDPQKIVVLGFSAAGHLCATAGTATEGEKPNAMVLCYPVIDFGRYAHEGSAENLLGKPYEEITDEEKEKWSGQCRVTVDTCPAFIWHTADDPVVPAQNSLLMAGALMEKGVDCTLHIFPHGPHGVGLSKVGEEPYVWVSLMMEWLRHLWK